MQGGSVIASILLALMAWSGASGAAVGSSSIPLLEETLSKIRECMRQSPAPWPEAWCTEYVEAIRAAIARGPGIPQLAKRLQILSGGFVAYWESLEKGTDRSRFELDRAQIRWYTETLMAAEPADVEERSSVRDRYSDLADWAIRSLVTQFPFLDPNMVGAAEKDHLAKCSQEIETPLVPIFLQAFSESQIEQIQKRWWALRYARADWWRQLAGSVSNPTSEARTLPVRAHPHYVLAQRSLAQLRGQIWSQIPAPPDYYRDAVAKESAARKRRLQSEADARSQEERLGVAVLQTEYLSFLLAALLETAQEQEP